MTPPLVHLSPILVNFIIFYTLVFFVTNEQFTGTPASMRIYILAAETPMQNITAILDLDIHRYVFMRQIVIKSMNVKSDPVSLKKDGRGRMMRD